MYNLIAYNLTAFMNGYAPELQALSDEDKVKFYNSLSKELDEAEARVIMLENMYKSERKDLFVSGDGNRYICLKVSTIVNTDLFILGVEQNKTPTIGEYILIFNDRGVEREVPFNARGDMLMSVSYAIGIRPLVNKSSPKEPEKRAEPMKTEAESEAQPVEITITEKPNKSGFSWRYKLW